MVMMVLAPSVLSLLVVMVVVACLMPITVGGDGGSGMVGTIAARVGGGSLPSLFPHVRITLLSASDFSVACRGPTNPTTVFQVPYITV